MGRGGGFACQSYRPGDHKENRCYFRDVILLDVNFNFEILIILVFTSKFRPCAGNIFLLIMGGGVGGFACQSYHPVDHKKKASVIFEMLSSC